MALETTLTDIIVRLRQGRFPNEQAISKASSFACFRSWAGTATKTGACTSSISLNGPCAEATEILGRYLTHGWVVTTDLNNMLKRIIIRLAAEVAVLLLGKDVIMEL